MVCAGVKRGVPGAGGAGLEQVARKGRPEAAAGAAGVLQNSHRVSWGNWLQNDISLLMYSVLSSLVPV